MKWKAVRDLGKNWGLGYKHEKIPIIRTLSSDKGIEG